MDAPSIAKQLRTDPVYVAPGLPVSTDSDITGLLNSSDGIKVVVLADKQDVTAAAKQIQAGKTDGTVLIVASGDEVTAVSTSIPAGTMSDLVSRAENISGNGLDTIRTLVGNVHGWEQAHPAVDVAPAAPSHEAPLYVPIGVALGPLVIVALVVTVIVRRTRRVSATVKGTGPGEIRPLVRELMNRAVLSRSARMERAVTQLCEYTEAFFSRTKRGTREQVVMETHLKNALSVVKVFNDITATPYFYREPDKMRAEGIAAVEGLRDSVLESVRSTNARNLIDYNVNTKILKAQVYR